MKHHDVIICGGQCVFLHFLHRFLYIFLKTFYIYVQILYIFMYEYINNESTEIYYNLSIVLYLYCYIFERCAREF